MSMGRAKSPMNLIVAGAAAALVTLACTAGAMADAREDFAKEVLDEISTQHLKCTYNHNAGCGGSGEGDICVETMGIITDLKSDLASAEMHKKGVYRYWKYVTGYARASCMRALLGKATYCKTVNLVARFDPHRNCPEPGRTNSTCWLNRSWEREVYLGPNEENEWTLRCPVDEVRRMEFEDEE